MSPSDLAQVLRHLPSTTADKNLLVGNNTFDDAGVYRLDDNTALVQTVDFFAPVVDDPYYFGRIAAANALSDIYAMGARPLTCLNIAAFPVDRLPLEILANILRGGLDAVSEAGAVIVGGHTIDDEEPKYGLAVTGIAHPGRFLTNAGANAGDIVVLTKPLGIGIITTAMKRTTLPEEIVSRAISVMTHLNRRAAEAALAHRATACTDVTGFGFLGHLHELASASRLAVEVDSARIPIIDGTLDLARQGFICGGSRANKVFAENFTDFAEHIPDELQFVLADAITSGGLLITLPEAEVPGLLADLAADAAEAGMKATAIGRMVAGPPGRLMIR